MKTLIHRVGVRLAVIAMMAACAGSALAADDDVNQIFQMGRAAYYKGDMETAYQLLKQVEARNPKHFETKALLAQIRSQMKPDTGSLKRTYESVILPKVEFSEVTVEEAMEGLRALAKGATAGKVMPNIIVKDPALNAKTLSLNLHNVPLTEAIQYVASIAGARVTYDKHAAMIVPASATAGN